MGSIPNMRVYIPSDRIQTKALFEALLEDEKPAYIRVGRNAVEDVYEEENINFEFDKAAVIHEGDDLTIIACGELVKAAQKAANTLEIQGIKVRVLDMYCVKPIDKEAVEKAAKETKAIITIEEHTFIGGLGSMVSQIVSATTPKRVINLALPDAPVVTGVSQEVFDYYGLNEEGLVKTALELMKDVR
jgi:transketolase